MPITAPASIPASQPSPPRLLFVDGRPMLLATEEEAERAVITSGGESATLTGAFAASLNALLAGHASPADLQRLGMLESFHPWLFGLQRARPAPERGLAAAVLPLGMLFVELTARCNERCIHCYAESGPERTERLSLAEIQAVLDSASALGRPFVQFTGGDPLVHPDLVQAVAHARSLEVAGLEIYTNGLLLTDTLVDQLAPYAPRLCFSVYADTPGIHDAITRVPGSWKRTLAAMHRARKAGLEIRAGIALMDENLDHASRTQALLQRELGMDETHIRFDPVKQAGRGRPSPRLQQLHADSGHTPAGVDAMGKLCIAADGSVYPCIFARRTPLGNIRTTGLDAIVENLAQRRPAPPSSSRWMDCQNSLSCLDCRMNVYALGTEGLEPAI